MKMDENGASKMSVDLFLLDMVTARINLKIIKKFNLFQTENRNVIFFSYYNTPKEKGNQSDNNSLSSNSVDENEVGECQNETEESEE